MGGVGRVLARITRFLLTTLGPSSGPAVVTWQYSSLTTSCPKPPCPHLLLKCPVSPLSTGSRVGG